MDKLNFVRCPVFCKSSHHVLRCKSTQSTKVEVVVPHMPPLGHVVALHHETNQRHDFELQNVELIWCACHIRHQLTLDALDPEPFMEQQYLVVDFLKLSQTHDVGCESWDQIDSIESLMCTISALEQDHPPTLDRHDRTVAEMDNATHADA